MTMSIGEILTTAGIYTALGMGVVFAILVFISICIWLMGMILKQKPESRTETASVESTVPAAEDPSIISPEIIAVITAAIHQSIKDEQGDSDEYIVRKVRRATWKHTS